MGKLVLERKEAIVQEGSSPGIKGPSSPECRRGSPILVLVSFMTFSIWEAKQVPPRDKGLVLET